MTLYERLIKDLKHGKYPVVVDKYGDYRIFYNLKEDGVLRSFGIENTIQEVWVRGDSASWSEQEIEDYVDLYDWKFHSYFYPPIEPYKVGQKVRVSKEILKFEDLVSAIREWTENETILEITKQETFCNGSLDYRITNNNKNSWYIHHTYLEPVYDDEPMMTKEEFLALGKKHGWVKNGDVIE